MFKITEHLEFNSKGRASCPNCTSVKGKPNTNLSLIPNTDGAYKCHRGCTPVEIRTALGVDGDRQVPTAIANPSPAARKTTVSPQKVREAHEHLMTGNNAACDARTWLAARGITIGMMERYQLGIVRAKCGDRHLPAIAIPIPANADGTAYHQKKRIMPWMPEADRPNEYKPWSQAGITATTWFTWLPAEATQTILCEGEWDAMMMGQLMREADQPIAVACFTCGAGNVPQQHQLDLLPGTVYICYDLDEPGRKGAQKVAMALGDRARIMECPAPLPHADGYDVSDAINRSRDVGKWQQAMQIADMQHERPKQKPNALRDRLVSNADMIANAPDYVEMLVPDLLPANEMIMLAAGARSGKSLWAMQLAKAVATGENFLDRPVIQGAVLYVCLEDAPVKIKQRQMAQGWNPETPVYWLDRFKMSQIDDLRALALELDVRLIILDTLSRIRDDDVTESSSEMSRVMEPYQELASELNICILLVHHTNKVTIDNAGTVNVFDTIRGSSAIRATCRGSLVLAADNDCYRLCAENGYGKTDLKVRLDTNTLEWKLIGRWTEQVSSDLKTTVLDFLNKVGQASLEQIFDATQIGKNSLYKTLSRLAGDGMISRTGHRRNVLYTRSIGLIGQSESSSDSQNADSESVKGAIRQKKISSLSDSKVPSDQKPSEPLPDNDLNEFGITHEHFADHFERIDHFEDVSDTHVYTSANGSNIDAVSVTATGQPSDKSEMSGQSDPYIQPATTNDRNCALDIGDEVEILKEGSLQFKLTIVRRFKPSGLIVTRPKRGYVEQEYQRSNLRLVRRGDGADGLDD